MREAWTGRLVGKMHVHEITANEVAKEMGVCKAYVSMMMNGKRTPPGARSKLEDAVNRIIERKTKK